MNCYQMLPLKTQFQQACQNWILGYEKLRVSSLQFRKLLLYAWSHAATTGTAAAGFPATGIYLLDIRNS
jgi:hypothetical protein